LKKLIFSVEKSGMFLPVERKVPFARECWNPRSEMSVEENEKIQT
jgi:hypothetical protein